MATTKVYLLANELGVKSTAIIKKCQDEGLDYVKNHMTTISAGLAATIREWFSEGEHITTEETSEKVDLQKVRIKKKAKATKPEQAATALAESSAALHEQSLQTFINADAAAAVVEPMAQAQIIQPTVQPPTKETPAWQVQAIAEQAVTRQPAKEQTAATEPAKKEPAKIKLPTPRKPEPIKPAGPMLSKPKPAKLAGPKVVRVEAVEPAATPETSDQDTTNP